METLKSAIITMVDTGSCERVIIKDIHEYYPNEYTDQEIKDKIQEMLENNELIDRGAYLVYDWRKHG